MWISQGGWVTAESRFRTLKSTSTYRVVKVPRHQKQYSHDSRKGEKLYHNRKRRKRVGFGSCLELEKHVALVLDIHHHWCNSNGEYIEVNDDRVKRIIDSWRGVRSAMHYSVSREDYITGHRTDVRPRFSKFSNARVTKSKTCYPVIICGIRSNEWAGTFRKDFDIMVEAKM